MLAPRSSPLVSVCAVGLFCALMPSAASAQVADGGAALDGGTVAAQPAYETVVSSLRLPRKQTDDTSAVTVLNTEEISRATSTNADDLLRTVPSVETFRRSSSLVADPTSQGLSLRNVGPSSVSRALVLVDGMPFNDPFGGWVYWEALSLLDIGQIEIAPTGASALYGNLGLGGVAEFISKPITRGAQAEASGGSFGTFDARARGGELVGPLGAAAFGEFLTTSGYNVVASNERGAVDGPASSTHGVAGGRVELKATDRLTLTAQGRFFAEDENGGTNWTRSRVRMGWYGVGGHYDTPASGVFNAQVFGNAQEFYQDRGRVNADRSVEVEAGAQGVPSHSEGASVGWRSPAGLLGRRFDNTLFVGADLLDVRGSSTETLFPASAAPTALVGREAGGEQQFGGVFAEEVARVGRFDLSGAVRLDLWRNLDGALRTQARDDAVVSQAFATEQGTQVDPKVGARFHVTDAISLNATGYRAFRVPTLNELYRPFQVGTILTDANAALRPETLWGAELGPRFILGSAVVRVTGFYNDLQNPVTNVTLPATLLDGAARQRQNLGSARIVGGELELDWRIARKWLATGGYTYADARVTSAPADRPVVGRQLPQAPMQRAAAALTFEDPRLFKATAQLRFTGPQFEDDLNTLPMAGYVLVDLRASKDLSRAFSLFGVIENLFNQTYLVGRSGVTTIGAPFNVRVGLEFRTR